MVDEIAALKKTDVCMICNDSFSNGDKVIVVQCGNPGHFLCQDCWFNKERFCRGDACPLCRSPGIGIEANVLICYTGNNAEEAIPVD